MREIPWFNPREMDDATVLALATGREALLEEFLQAVGQRVEAPVPGGHWLVTGTFGAGKSYFLRLAQVAVARHFSPDQLRCVLLPEELPNVTSPHEFLDEIARMLRVGEGDTGKMAQWRTDDPHEAWADSKAKLLSAFAQPLLVVGVENMADLVRGVFQDDLALSLFRKLLAEEPRLLFLASAVNGTFDENYGQRLFRAFAHHPLPLWKEDAHRDYLTARAKLLQRTPTSRQLTRIDAYSRYTGGNARVAAILAATILDEQALVEAGTDLNSTVEKMSKYYLSLLAELPSNTKTLFDALVRGGEPCSQTGLAERVGAKQSDISRAFRRMLDAGYLLAERPKGQKETLYRVADRLFVQWYRMRYLEPGQRSRLAVLAELLADTLSRQEKWSFTRHFAARGEEDDARVTAELGFLDHGIDIGKLGGRNLAMPTLLRYMVQLDGESNNGLTQAQPRKDPFNRWPIFAQLELLEQFPSDEAMRDAINDAFALASACTRFPGAVSGEALAQLIMGSMSLSPVEKLRALQALTRTDFSSVQWGALEKVLKDEVIGYEKLMLTEPDGVEWLRQNVFLEKELPFSASLGHMYRLASGLVVHEGGDALMLLEIAGSATAMFSALKNADRDGKLGESHSFFCTVIHRVIRRGHFSLAVRALQALLKAWPDGQENARRGELYSLLAEVKRHSLETALPEAERAVALLRGRPERRSFLYALSCLTWLSALSSNWHVAKTASIEALNLESDGVEVHPWYHGQLARCIVHLEGVQNALVYLGTVRLRSPQDEVRAFSQLGDAVWDLQRTSGESSAYALARTLLQPSAARTLEAVRALFIAMIDTGVDLDLLRTLAEEWPGWFGADRAYEKGDDREVQELATALRRWIADLQSRTSAHKGAGGPKRKEVASGNDPDWLTTLKALNESLDPGAQIRYGLLKPEPISAEAQEIFDRLLAFIR
jgi:predicted transcriptional regulator